MTSTLDRPVKAPTFQGVSVRRKVTNNVATVLVTSSVQLRVAADETLTYARASQLNAKYVTQTAHASLASSLEALGRPHYRRC